MARYKKPSVRQLRVGEELRHALAEVLGRGELRDPNLRGRAITVTEVRASPDLKRAIAFVTPLGDESTDPGVLMALGRASSYLQGEIGRRIRLKFTPRLSFEFDDRFEYASKIDNLLREPGVSRDLADGESIDGTS
jgi:ribosome-binding factor A